MINARCMYLRPGNLFKDFVVEKEEQKVLPNGRVAEEISSDGTRIIKGCLAQANAEEVAKRSDGEHTVTHTIVQSGPPMAKRRERLVLGDRVFYIVDVDDAGSLGLATIYYAEERRDVR